MTDQKLLTLRVHSRDGMIFEGKVKNLTSFNDMGEFDVLQMHAIFISLIKDYVIIRLPNGEEQRINLDSAILRVHGDEIEVFMGVKEGKK